jgi:sodium-dependent dicarboxylate transporter 2/3/5
MPDSGGMRTRLQWIGLALGPGLAFLTLSLLPHSYADPLGITVEFAVAGRVTAALGVWMAVWWLTAAIPVYATALLPLAVLPFAGAGGIRETAAPYAHELIFLFMGGFIIALAMQRWGLHRRIALNALRFAGTRPAGIVAGFMAVTAFLSLWVSNTATTIMMLPIALSIIGLSDDDASAGTPSANFAPALLLGIAYSASIGGIGTLIGTPPNLFLASFAESELGISISFVRWMAVGLPLVIVFVPITWFLLTRLLFPLKDEQLAVDAGIIPSMLGSLGGISRGERITLVVFVLTAAAWMARPLLTQLTLFGARPLAGLTDAGVAITAALVLFVCPVDARKRVFAMDWDTATRLPWGLLLLFGGGLSLAGAISRNGVSEFIGSQVASLGTAPMLVMIIVVVTMMIFLTELTSNIATTAALVPILAAIAPPMGFHPLLLAVPAAIAASCAFMLPVATPPNAIVFGSGHVDIAQMVRAGFGLNLIGIVLITALAYLLALPLLVNGY